MPRTSFGWIGPIIVTVSLAACQPVASPGNAAAPAAPATLPATGQLRPSRTLTVSASAIITEEGIVEMGEGANNPVVKQAMQDLGTRLGVGPDAITLVSAEAVVWPDAGLGCPRPGMGYKQVQQDGMRIVLQAQGRQFEYHSGAGKPPFLCESPAGN